jgi:type I restriction enzyme, S subunit
VAKASKSAVMPRLRFPEFREGGGWTSAALHELAAFVTDRVGITECVPYTVTSGAGLVSQQEKLGRTIAGNSIKNYVLLQRDDFAFNKSATKAFPQGYIARYVGDERAAVPNSIFTSFRVNEHTIFPAYLDHLFSSNLHGKWLRNYITIGARAHGSLNVNDGDLMALPVPLPGGSTALKEQQKIAEFLTSLDELIAAKGRKVEALKTFKRGLMQQLFPREGETFPRLRFPEFCVAPEWEERQLDTCFSHIRNGFVGTATPFYVAGGIPYLQGKNVKKGRIDPSGLVMISKSFHEEQKKSHLRRSDIVMVQSGHVGECALIDGNYAGANCHALIIMTPVERQHSPFFVQCFGSDFGARLIAHITTGNTIRHVLASDVKALVVRVPHFDEQQHIAACLSSLDDEIAAETDKLLTLKAHKRGLIQKLFPSPEKV